MAPEMERGKRRYLAAADEIYAESFRIAAAETDLSGMDESLRPLALRLVHATGDPAVAGLVAASDGAVRRGAAALAAGGRILADCEMVAAGITRRLLPAGNEVVCLISDARVREMARRRGSTRSAAAVDLWGTSLTGSVAAIGNAPTALFRLLERIDEGMAAPALIVAMPVGFVGAAEAKQALADSGGSIAYIAVTGRRGGSALAAAAINQLAIEAAR